MSNDGKKVSGTFMPKNGLLVQFMSKKSVPHPAAHPAQNTSGATGSTSLKVWTDRPVVQSKDQPTSGNTPSPLHLGSALLANVSTKEPKGPGVSSVTAKPRPNAWKQDDGQQHCLSELTGPSTLSSNPALQNMGTPRKSDDHVVLQTNTDDVKAHSNGGRLRSSSPLQRPSAQIKSSPTRSESSRSLQNAYNGLVTSNLPPSFPQNPSSLEVPLLVCPDYARNFGQCPLAHQCPKLHVVLLPTLSKSYGIPGLEFLPSAVPLDLIKKHYNSRKKHDSDIGDGTDEKQPYTPPGPPPLNGEGASINPKYRNPGHARFLQKPNQPIHGTPTSGIDAAWNSPRAKNSHLPRGKDPKGKASRLDGPTSADSNPVDPNRNNRDPNRDNRNPNRDNRNPNRDNKDPNRDNKDPNRDNKDPNRDNKDSIGDNRDPNRDNKDSIGDNRDPIRDNIVPSGDTAKDKMCSGEEGSKNEQAEAQKIKGKGAKMAPKKNTFEMRGSTRRHFGSMSWRKRGQVKEA
ncbi:hypothetical protein BmR1_04g09835 [Babesia microti strain RI]|uniref:C3H1-type domain-containing protein n=1 Tax=Babesia microti (strain RI) TaxID=1133968 RepID=I7IA52_BABMR|nr:hypothetical protein BmR1_04g09835 [Babesia microti strain RI]CCF76134.1 hypothetical protein BmR1_04g09835 [Babesia microti strain RI]|eukprot:XP_012650542.1 hypothetical protein BmR1_04g09835 [Babesia microti strain RI]